VVLALVVDGEAFGDRTYKFLVGKAVGTYRFTLPFTIGTFPPRFGELSIPFVLRPRPVPAAIGFVDLDPKSF
jgi:hypothetical protein